MASEITITASISFFKSSVMNQAVGQAITNLLVNVSGSYYIEGQVLATTSATVIPLGQVTAPHYCFLKNVDPTNYVQFFNGASGAVVGKLKAGEIALFPWDDGATPYVKANTASVVVEYIIISL